MRQGLASLSALALLFWGGLALAQNLPQNLPLPRASSWLAADGRLEALTTEPVTDLVWSEALQETTAANVQGDTARFAQGEALFRNPFLLGGQAAKAGLSCNSCHNNGRGNPHFQFPGISGAPGTADVTHSFFSPHRGNGNFDPVAIPDLTQAGKISRNKKNRALEEFVRDLIVEEFSGQEPSEQVLSALAYYIRNIRAPANNKSRQLLSLSADLSRVRKGIDAAQSWPGSSTDADLLLSGVQHQLGLIHERLLAGDDRRKQLQAISRELGAVRALLRAGRIAPAQKELRAWRIMFDDLSERLRKNTARSLYDRDVLIRALEQ